MLANSFVGNCETEKVGNAKVMPLLRSMCFQGEVWLNQPADKRRTFVVQALGDFVGRDVLNENTLIHFEVKNEKENKHGNLFLETWSNWRLIDPRLGWLWTSNADKLVYHFIRERVAYIGNMMDIREWAHRNVERFPFRKQDQHAQANETWGRCVPIGVLLNLELIREFPVDYEPGAYDE